ncbi:hypothetical protein IO89_02725 [Epilithonimonas lactis]|uniref:RagB/SusD family nutrient uptake outer membrane protein n=1 Tax=Epilithonimonas lactis TaxID=421072 RepID=A0A085BM20_9FLAO|nr:hypothetical protein IO89_02725 [Epilithonimonas lactis]
MAASFAATLFSSCSEERLIENPVDQFPIDQAITKESDMRSVLNGIYDQYSTSQGFGADILAFGDLISDNVFITSTNTDVAYRNTGFLNWSSDISDFAMLDELYDGIILSNLVINNNSLEETPNVINYKGEARIARALGYYYAVSYYSPNPTSGVNQEYGVPLNLGVYDPRIKLPRASVAEVYDQIVTDLTTALSTMTVESGQDKGYLSKMAARILLSRVYLTRGAAGDYQKSIDLADEAINMANPNVGVFDFVGTDPDPLADNAGSYYNYFASPDKALSANQKETVWEINMDQNPSENPGVNNALSSFYANNGSKKRFLFTDSFFKSFPTTDFRQKLFNAVGTPNEGAGVPRGVWTRKYVVGVTVGGSNAPHTQNVKVLRMSEAYLNKIEALFKLGRLPEALTQLNAFAASRKGSTYTAATLANILTERRKEFFGEGQRFFDLKRNNLGFTRSTNCYSIVCSVEPNSKLFVIPMPLREMNVNPNMEQYPDWR